MSDDNQHQLPSHLCWKPHRPYWNDGHSNFERIRGVWKEPEQKRENTRDKHYQLSRRNTDTADKDPYKIVIDFQKKI